MDAIEIILYVVIMLVWVIVQNARKKKLKQQQEAQRKAAQSNFDEIDEEVEETQPNNKSLIDEIIRELKNEDELSDIEIESENQYTPTVQKDFSQSETSSTVKKYDERLTEMKARKKEKETQRFDHYKIEKKFDVEDEETENEYASLIFEDPDSPKKAIILSEILNRKHF